MCLIVGHLAAEIVRRVDIETLHSLDYGGLDNGYGLKSTIDLFREYERERVEPALFIGNVPLAKNGESSKGYG